MIKYTIYCLVVFMFVIVLHELLHLLLLYIFTKKKHYFDLKKFSIKYDERMLTTTQEIMVLLVAVVLGALVYIRFTTGLHMIVGLLAYLYCCKSDILRTVELMEEMEE